MTNGLRFVFSLIISYSAAVIGSVATFRELDIWYNTLVKPSFSPPNWIFGPVWSFLYLLIGISLFLLWKRGYRRYKNTFLLFIGHIALNALWSIAFFGMHNIVLAFLIIVAMIATLIVLIEHLWRIYRSAAYLLFPYILWITFAAILNFSIFLLN